MKYQPTILITNDTQLIVNPPQCGQWIQLAWLDKPSRFHHSASHGVTAFHHPRACSAFNSYSARRK